MENQGYPPQVPPGNDYQNPSSYPPNYVPMPPNNQEAGVPFEQGAPVYQPVNNDYMYQPMPQQGMPYAPAEPPVRRKKKTAIVVILVILLLAILAGIIALLVYLFVLKPNESQEINVRIGNETAIVQTEQILTATTETAKTVATADVNKAKEQADKKLKEVLGDEFSKLVKQSVTSGGSYSYAFYDVESDTSYGEGNVTRCRAASVSKPVIMAKIYQLAEAGSIDLQHQYRVQEKNVVGGSGVIYGGSRRVYTTKELVELMMHESDNTAANELIDICGGFSVLNDYAKELGCLNTHFGRYYMQQATSEETENWISAGDLVRIVAKMQKGELVSKDADREMLSVMRDDDAEELFFEQMNKSQVIDSYAKGGEIANSRSCVNVIETNKGTYVIAGLEDQANVEDIKDDMRRIGKQFYDLYEPFRDGLQAGR